MKSRLAWVLAVGMLSSGCTVVQSVYPIASNETAVYDASLVGVWMEDKNSDEAIYILSPEDTPTPAAYQLRLVDGDPGKPSERGIVHLKLTLRKIGDKLWGDVVAAEDENDFYLKTHFFVRLEKRAGITIALRMLKWSKIPVADRPASIELPGDKGFLMTGEAAALISFLERFGSKDEFFDDDLVLRRVNP
ncbi:MAG: hypothetical protein ABI811_24395 [Acidobacteriota bacterium]